MKQDVRTFSDLHNLMVTLQEAFGQLDIILNNRSLEKMAVFLLQVSTTRNRSYHDIKYFLKIPPGYSPIQVIAHLFHSTVFWEIDRARHRTIRSLLSPIKLPENSEKTFRVQLDDMQSLDTENINECKNYYSRYIFDLYDAKTLEFHNGVNQFLSACVVENMLKKILKPWQLIQIIACIKMTERYQFCNNSASLQSLRLRILDLVKTLKIRVSEEEIDSAIKSGLQLVYNQVTSYSSENVAFFLADQWSQTWEIHPEVQQKSYSISSYRNVLINLYNHLSNLKPKNIFPQYQNKPPSSTLVASINKAEKNIKIGVLYLKIKIIAIALLEAIAEETKDPSSKFGDIPIVLFTASATSPNSSSVWDKFWLDALKDCEEFNSDDQNTVFSILLTGRPDRRYLTIINGDTIEETTDLKSKFDTNKSYISAYLFSKLKPDTLESIFIDIKNYLKGTIPATTLLSGPIRNHLKHLFDILEITAISRKDALIDLRSRLKV